MLLLLALNMVSFEVDTKTGQIKFTVEESIFVIQMERVLKLILMELHGCTAVNENKNDFYRIEFDKSAQSLNFESNYKHLSPCRLPLRQLLQNKDFALSYAEFKAIKPLADRDTMIKRPADAMSNDHKEHLPSDNAENKMASMSQRAPLDRSKSTGRSDIDGPKKCPRCGENLVLAIYGNYKCPHCSFEEEDTARNPILDPVKVSNAAWKGVFKYRGG